MLFIILAAAAIAGALVNWRVSAGRKEEDPRQTVELFLVYIVVIFFGGVQLVNGLMNIAWSDRWAMYIGWPAGNPFQKELGFACLGMAAVSILAVWLRGIYFMAPVVGNAVYLLGAAGVHIREIVRSGNLHSGNAGPVLYTGIVMPITAFVLMIIYFRMSRHLFEARK